MGSERLFMIEIRTGRKVFVNGGEITPIYITTHMKGGAHDIRRQFVSRFYRR